jgi:hypothetical protein
MGVKELPTLQMRFPFSVAFSVRYYFVLNLYTMGVKDGCGLLQPSNKTTHSLKGIRQQYLMNENPMVVIDVSIWLRRAKAGVGVLLQFTLYFQSEVKMLWWGAKFELVFVFYGRYHPGKDATHTHFKRYNNRDDLLADLETTYGNQATTFEQIKTLQKKAVYVWEDVVYDEVLKYAKEEKIFVVEAPFEADSQMYSLLCQGICDLALAEDGGILYQGAAYAIMNLMLQGKCDLVAFNKLVSEKLKQTFESTRDLTQSDLMVFCCIQGNGYIYKIPGSGLVTTIQGMKQWVMCDDQNKFIGEYLAIAGAPIQNSFTLP